MEEKYFPGKGWEKRNKIIINDVLNDKRTGFPFFCSHVIPYDKFEYLYFSSFDFNSVVFCVQINQGGINYLKVLDNGPEQDFAFRLFENKYGEEMYE